MKIRNKLIIYFLVILIVPFSILSYVLLKNSQKNLEEQIISKLEALADHRKDQIEEFLDSNINIIKTIANTTTVGEKFAQYNNTPTKKSQNALIDEISEFSNFEKETESLSLISLSGMTIASTDKKIIGADVSQEPFYLEVKNKPGAYFTNGNGISKITFIAPIYLNGKFLGLIRSIVNINPLELIIRNNAGLGKTGEAMFAVRGKDNNPNYVIKRLYESQAISKAKDILPMISALKGEERSLNPINDYRGIKVIAVTRYIKSINAGLVVEVDQNDINAPLKNVFTATMVISFFSIFLAVLVAWFFSNNFSNPIKKLTEITKDISKDNLQVSFPKDLLESKNEIGILSSSFKSTLDILIRDITERKKAELEREQYFKLFNLSTDIMVIADPLGCFKKVNPACLKILGYSEKELLQKPFIDFVFADDKQPTKDEMDRQMKLGYSLYFENRYVCKDGSMIWLSWQASYNKEEGITYATARDITDRKKAERNIARINRAIRMVSSINQVLIHFTNSKELLDEACRIAVEAGGYSLAWVGYREEDEGKTILPVAYAGEGEEYIKQAELSWGDNLRGHGPSGIAIKTMKFHISRFIEKDVSMTPWQENAKKYGYKSSIALPLINSKKAFGVLSIYSSEVDAFDEEEVKILNELSGDLAFGLSTFNIREDMSKFKKAVETSGEIIYLTNPDGIITFINSEFTKNYGYNPDEVVGKVTPRILKSGLRGQEEYLNLWKDLLAGKVVKDEHYNKSKDGRILMVESVTSPIFDENKNIIGFLATQLDITERKKKENELQENAEELEKFKMAVEAASDHIILTDNKGVIIYANKDTENFTGYSREDIIGKTATLWGGQMPKEFYENMWKTIKKDKKPFSSELVNRRKNGQLYDAELHISPVMNELGEIKYFIGVERDITKAKEIEKAKNDFLSMASHQLRTPLSAIKWVLETLEDSKNFTIKQKDKIKNLMISNERIISLVNYLLDVTRIESGKLVINKRDTDIRELFNKLNTAFKSLADSKKKIININIPPTIKNIYCDPVFISEALSNVVHNAIIYSQEDSKNIDIKITEQAEDYLISVHNDGVIDDITLSRIKIFDKFVRGSRATEVKPEGSGLGLYLAKSIIEASGGRLWCESNAKSGTTFFLTIIKEKTKN